MGEFQKKTGKAGTLLVDGRHVDGRGFRAGDDRDHFR